MPITGWCFSKLYKLLKRLKCFVKKNDDDDDDNDGDDEKSIV